MNEDIQNSIAIGCVLTIAISLVIIATQGFQKNDRDLNGDSKVDIVDLSILADEIATRNTNK